MANTQKVNKTSRINEIIGIKTQRLGSLLIVDLICWADNDEDELQEIQLQLEGDFGPVRKITVRH